MRRRACWCFSQVLYFVLLLRCLDTWRSFSVNVLTSGCTLRRFRCASRCIWLLWLWCEVCFRMFSVHININLSTSWRKNKSWKQQTPRWSVYFSQDVYWLIFLFVFLETFHISFGNSLSNHKNSIKKNSSSSWFVHFNKIFSDW